MSVGYISYLNSIKVYGFIDSPELQLDHIFFHSANCIKSYKHIFKGDKVSFELVTAGEKGNDAVNISFIQNASLDGLRKDFENNTTLKGFLKKIDDKYYVKDKDTYIFIRLIIANYEINLNEVYENNINKLIEYKIITLTNKNKIRAININRQFLPACNLLVEGNKTEGLVVAVVKGGYQIKIYDNILVFIPNSLVMKSKNLLEVGEILNVTCIKASDKLENVVFDLTDNINNEINLKIEQEKLIHSLKPGDRFLGKIKAAKGYGIFIDFGLCDGLLYIRNIVGDYTILSESSKKEFSKMLKKNFLKGQEIDVIIEENTPNRISLTWDCQTERNKLIYESYLAKFKLLTQSE